MTQEQAPEDFNELEFEKLAIQGERIFRIFENAKKVASGVRIMRQRAFDAEKAATALEARVETLRADLEEVEQMVKQAEQVGVQTVAIMKEEAKKIIADAEAEKEEIIRNAQAVADSATENASRNIREMQENADKMLAKTNQAIDSKQALYDEAVQMKEENDRVRAELRAEQERLDKIKADLVAIMNVKG